jgi:hypothetical protein
VADSYFLPPTIRKLPRPSRVPEIRSRRFLQFLWTRTGETTEGSDGFVVAGVEYLAGRWNGPLESDQVSALTAAGYGDRIFAVDDLGDLPADIDS